MGRTFVVMVIALSVAALLPAAICRAEDDVATKVLKSGLVGAGTGALSAGMSGGKAGKGALIGMGTGIVGSILLDAITGTPSSGSRRRYTNRNECYCDEDEFYEPAKTYETDAHYEPTGQATRNEIIKDGIVGAGTGAIAAGTSGGKAGQGALIGAGTGIIGNVLLDSITKPNSEHVVRRVHRARSSNTPRQKVIRKYDSNGNLIYEEITPLDD